MGLLGSRGYVMEGLDTRMLLVGEWGNMIRSWGVLRM